MYILLLSLFLLPVSMAKRGKSTTPPTTKYLCAKTKGVKFVSRDTYTIPQLYKMLKNVDKQTSDCAKEKRVQFGKNAKSLKVVTKPNEIDNLKTFVRKSVDKSLKDETNLTSSQFEKYLRIFSHRYSEKRTSISSEERKILSSFIDKMKSSGTEELKAVEAKSKEFQVTASGHRSKFIMTFAMLLLSFGGVGFLFVAGRRKNQTILSLEEHTTTQFGNELEKWIKVAQRQRQTKPAPPPTPAPATVETPKDDKRLKQLTQKFTAEQAALKEKFRKLETLFKLEKRKSQFYEGKVKRYRERRAKRKASTVTLPPHESIPPHTFPGGSLDTLLQNEDEVTDAVPLSEIQPKNQAYQAGQQAIETVKETTEQERLLQVLDDFYAVTLKSEIMEHIAESKFKSLPSQIEKFHGNFPEIIAFVEENTELKEHLFWAKKTYYKVIVLACEILNALHYSKTLLLSHEEQARKECVQIENEVFALFKDLAARAENLSWFYVDTRIRVGEQLPEDTVSEAADSEHFEFYPQPTEDVDLRGSIARVIEVGFIETKNNKIHPWKIVTYT